MQGKLEIGEKLRGKGKAARALEKKGECVVESGKEDGEGPWAGKRQGGKAGVKKKSRL